MLRYLRTHASPIAMAALVSLIGVALGELRPHAPDCHEGACAGAILFHDAAAHRVSAAPASAADAHDGFHCAGCHLSRSFRPSPLTTCFHALPLDRRAGSQPRTYRLQPGPAITQPSLRAPPSPVHA